jgi:hypothetical protein
MVTRYLQDILRLDKTFRYHLDAMHAQSGRVLPFFIGLNYVSYEHYHWLMCGDPRAGR